jgi:AcrR family transcriptional regulator
MSMSSAAAGRSPTGRATRRDAAGNRARLLAAAGEAFADAGTGASLEDVARAAGVGIGTLYRHFPTREALLEAVLGERFRRLAERGSALAASQEPIAALRTWLVEFAVGSTRVRGLATLLRDTIADETSALHASCLVMRSAGAALLEAARAAGDVRSDVGADDALMMAAAMAWAAEQDPAGVGRYVDLLLDGLRPRRD